MAFPKQVRLVEMSPRDGLQNEPGPVIDTAIKTGLIDRLADCGLNHIESASFVSPKWVPQMGDAAEVMAGIKRKAGVRYSVLTPNLRGFENALAAGVDEVAVFGAASESFSQKNINCSIAESLERFLPVMEAAKQHHIPVRGYVSTVLGCPYEGDIAPEQVAKVAKALAELGCYEISLGDTIGVGTPLKAVRMVEAVMEDVPIEQIALHFHDTYGQALANIYACLGLGVSVIDAAVGGLGGCPYAMGATGNVATEDLVYMLDGMGIATGIDLAALTDTARFIAAAIDKAPASHLARANA